MAIAKTATLEIFCLTRVLKIQLLVQLRKCFEIDAGSIPAADPERRDECMRWGDDYQLLFTVPEEVKIPIEAARIGTVCEGPAGVWLDGRLPAEDEVLGYRH